MKTEDVLREAESKLREKARYFNDDQLPTYVLALPDVMEVLRTVLGDRPSPALAESIRTHDLATGEGQAMFSEKLADAAHKADEDLILVADNVMEDDAQDIDSVRAGLKEAQFAFRAAVSGSGERPEGETDE